MKCWVTTMQVLHWHINFHAMLHLYYEVIRIICDQKDRIDVVPSKLIPA